MRVVSNIPILTMRRNKVRFSATERGARVRGSPKRFDSVVAADEDSVSASEDGSGCVAGRESYNGVSSLHTHLGYLVVGER